VSSRNAPLLSSRNAPIRDLFSHEAELASPKARQATEGDWPALADWLYFASWRVSASITSRRSRPHFPGCFSGHHFLGRSSQHHFMKCFPSLASTDAPQCIASRHGLCRQCVQCSIRPHFCSYDTLDPLLIFLPMFFPRTSLPSMRTTGTDLYLR